SGGPLVEHPGGLLGVEPGVEEGPVAGPVLGFAGVLGALVDVVGGGLQVQAGGAAALLGEDLLEAAELGGDVLDVPDLEPAGGLDGVAVPRVADPVGGSGPALHGPPARSQRGDAAVAHPRDGGEPAGFVPGVEHGGGSGGRLRCGGGAE